MNKMKYKVVDDEYGKEYFYKTKKECINHIEQHSGLFIEKVKQ